MGIRSGVDILEIQRIKTALSRENGSFQHRIFTVGEKEYCESRKSARMESYAVRFCAKEAVAKALGTGIAQGVSFTDIEILIDSKGKPHIALHGEALHHYTSLGGVSIDISLSHCREYAVAFAIIETKEA